MLSSEGGTLLLSETVTMLRSRDVILRKPALFWCMVHVLVSVIIPVFLFTNPSSRTGYDTRSIVKQSLTGVISEFFFLLD